MTSIGSWHQHPVQLQKSITPRGCIKCQKDGIESSITKFYECTKGCDWIICENCFKVAPHNMDPGCYCFLACPGAGDNQLNVDRDIGFFGTSLGLGFRRSSHSALLTDLTALNAITRITSFFNEHRFCRLTVLAFFGHGQRGTGNWEMKEGKISYEQIMDLWNGSLAKRAGSKLFLYMDSCYSGHWVNKAKEDQLIDVMIQASCLATEGALDNFFTSQIWTPYNRGKSLFYVKSQFEIGYRCDHIPNSYLPRNGHIQKSEVKVKLRLIDLAGSWTQATKDQEYKRGSTVSAEGRIYHSIRDTIWSPGTSTHSFDWKEGFPDLIEDQLNYLKNSENVELKMNLETKLFHCNRELALTDFGVTGIIQQICDGKTQCLTCQDFYPRNRDGLQVRLQTTNLKYTCGRSFPEGLDLVLVCQGNTQCDACEKFERDPKSAMQSAAKMVIIPLVPKKKDLTKPRPKIFLYGYYVGQEEYHQGIRFSRSNMFRLKSALRQGRFTAVREIKIDHTKLTAMQIDCEWDRHTEEKNAIHFSRTQNGIKLEKNIENLDLFCKIIGGYTHFEYSIIGLDKKEAINGVKHEIASRLRYVSSLSKKRPEWYCLAFGGFLRDNGFELGKTLDTITLEEIIQWWTPNSMKAKLLLLGDFTTICNWAQEAKSSTSEAVKSMIIQTGWDIMDISLGKREYRPENRTQIFIGENCLSSISAVKPIKGECFILQSSPLLYLNFKR